MPRRRKSIASSRAIERQRSLSQVSIATRIEEPVPPSRIVGQAGLRAQQVTLGTSTFDYEWRGREHYLALHDICLEEGETVTDEGRRGDPLRDLRGRLTFVPAGHRIWGWSAPAVRRNSFTAIYFDPQQLDEDIARRLKSVDLNPEVYFVDPALATTLGRIQAELQQVGSDMLYIESLCMVGALELVRHQRAQAAVVPRPAGTLGVTQVRRVHEYIEAHLTQDVALADLAALLQLSPFHFLRAFKKSTGHTPYQYLLKRRIERAQALLAQGRAPIRDIGQAVGFNSAARFVRAFKKQSGVTPGVFATLIADGSQRD